MKASITNPIYSARLMKSDGMVYYFKDITTDMNVSQPKNELAKKVSVSIINASVSGAKLHNIISLMDKLFVNADTGSGEKEVFRGIVWERSFNNTLDSDEVKIIAYDRLIYFNRSKDNFFAPAGKSTDVVISSIASKWGFSISYRYLNITHAKLTYHNEDIGDIITDILNKVKSQTGVDYVIYMDGDTIIIDRVGNNQTAYKIGASDNAISTNYKQSMEDVVTKVLIVKAETTKNGDKEEETGNYLTVASVDKNTEKYGTLQDVIVVSKDEKIAEAKDEANTTLKDNADPKETIDVKAIDIPWVQKGHQIYIESESMQGYYIVKSIEHDCTEGTMTLEVSRYE